MDPLAASEDIYQRLVKAAGEPAPAMRAWDGTRWGSHAAESTIVLTKPSSLRSLLLPPSDLTAGEAYVFGDIDIEGDVLSTLEFAARLEPLAAKPARALGIVRRLLSLPKPDQSGRPERPTMRGKRHSKGRDRDAVTHHYDTGNAFFAQFLDQLMVYSCAYFLDPAEPLEVAQRRKLDVVCRKLELSPGMRFLDVGCGWGALVIHAAQHYGVNATGITLSAEQAQLARQRAEAAGVANRVTITVADYREVEGRFDAIASVGMVEHVGESQLEAYFAGLYERLEPGGQLLNHGITNRDRSGGRPKPSFVNTYVFPDGELLPIETVVGAAEACGFEVRDLESLRQSYALTLRHWVANLESNHAAAASAANETVYRIWRVYMAGSVLAFETAGISIFQTLLAKPDRPWRYGRQQLLAVDDG